MGADNFGECLAETLKWEGGYSNDPHDPGGATMKGIIQREYDAWRDKKGLPRRGVLHIGDAEVSTIYRDEYWTVSGCDALAAGLDLAVFDTAVNNGARALKWTALAISGAPATADSIDIILDARLEFDRSLRIWRYFGVGWTRRIAGIRERAKIMAGVPEAEA